MFATTVASGYMEKVSHCVTAASVRSMLATKTERALRSIRTIAYGVFVF